MSRDIVWFLAGALVTALLAYVVYVHYTSAGYAGTEDIPAFLLLTPATRRRR
jgi:hypothetical protein